MGAEQLVGAVCSQCERREDLAACIACGKTICPSHRFGLGSLSDGYTCTMNCAIKGYRAAQAADSAETQVWEKSHIRERPGLFPSVVPAILALAVFTLAVVLLGAVIYARFR